MVIAETLILTESISTVLDSATGQDYIEILSIPSILAEIEQEFSPKFVFKIASYLESLVISCQLPSLGKSPFPDITVGTPMPEKLSKLVDIEETHDRVILQLGKKKGVGEWKDLATLPFLNKGREVQQDILRPYLTTATVKLLSANDNLGIRIVDVIRDKITGQSLETLDRITIEGAFRIEISLIEKATTHSNSTSFLVSNSSQEILPEDASRKSISFQNIGDTPCWIQLNQAAMLDQGVCLLPLGSFHTKDATTAFFAISSAETMLTVIHTYYGAAS